MIAKLLGVVLALFGWLRARADAKRAAAVAEAERVEAVRRDAAIRDQVAKLPTGKARDVLSRDWRRLAVLLVVAGGLSACGSPSVPVAVDTSCDWVRPILVADADNLTDATARDVLAHNETWKARCGARQ